MKEKSMSVEAEFAQRIHEELGEAINPSYVAEVLKKGIPDLFRWIQAQLQNNYPTVGESVQISESYPEHKLHTSPLPLEINVLEERFKLILFVLNEIRSRVNAIENST